MRHVNPESTRAEVRRQQILDAASTCFVRDGFHGTSVAKLAKTAGMSAGHIYHFFANKEAIIAALVERQLKQSLRIVEQVDSADDLLEVMIERVELGVHEQTNLDRAALEIEILAEAARNPEVATIVRAADREKRARLRTLLERMRQAHGLANLDAQPTIEVLMALFQGLLIRTIQDPGIDAAALLPVLQRTVRGLLVGDGTSRRETPSKSA